MLRDMSNGSIKTTIIGIESAFPFYISPAAMAKLADSLGEINMIKAAAKAGIIQGVRRIRTSVIFAHTDWNRYLPMRTAA
jgi:isopentenyl diphosphate isomerase/L-lactate dehydrogenase-like FMN-dependent dehydrogenase